MCGDCPQVMSANYTGGIVLFFVGLLALALIWVSDDLDIIWDNFSRVLPALEWILFARSVQPKKCSTKCLC